MHSTTATRDRQLPKDRQPQSPQSSAPNTQVHDAQALDSQPVDTAAAESQSSAAQEPQGPAGLEPEHALRAYRVAYQSRQASLIGRREVLTGKAKFGIFGDGKELAQVALAQVFRQGDFRSGYYRDQTLMLALGLTSIDAFFAQLYANTDPTLEPVSGGRQMTAHFSSRLLDEAGEWLSHTDRYNCSADVSPTASQMPRLVGLGYASSVYRQLPELAQRHGFSDGGREIAFGTIGNASCAEGMFWESVNAIGVLEAPVLLSIWDDDYGISVPNELQVTKGDLSDLLSGFQRRAGRKGGFEVLTVRGWDYPALCRTYERAERTVREHGVPAIVHVVELTQPQGHSTSGSHERYKSAERLDWEKEHDCVAKMRTWLLDQELISEPELEELEGRELERVQGLQRKAWDEYVGPIQRERSEVVSALRTAADGAQTTVSEGLETLAKALERSPAPLRRQLCSALQQALILLRAEDETRRHGLSELNRRLQQQGRERYSTHLFSRTAHSVLRVPEQPPIYAQDTTVLNGFEILNRCFDAALERMPELLAFGEDVGQLGDVNQGMSGLQEKYGALRVADTGIRECTILGQAIGMAMRGLRPIAEVQYLDYLLYALQIISDDLATLYYRTRGAQKAPVIVRTRGHRLEGIWHSGSPMAGILGLVRGVHVCVPRDMTRAAGFYNTLLASDESAIVVEVLNGYRLKERLPSNLGQMTLPLGVPEVLREGADVTVVTYGACCRIALDTAERLAQCGIDVEVIDVQTLLPFDRPGIVRQSLEKTNRVLFLDEDVPGGTTAYMLQQVVEDQGAFHWLDSEPRTLSAAPHRPAYGSDGDYWSKPNVETVFTAVYELMHEADPGRFPLFYR